MVKKATEIRALGVVGGAHVDRIARSAGAIVKGASNPGHFREAIGGAAFNAAVAARAMGVPVSLLSGRGGDRAADLVGEALAAHGIADRSVVWLDRPTPSYMALLDATGDLHAGIADMELYDLISPRVLRRRHIRDWLGSGVDLLIDANLSDGAIGSLCRAATGRIAAIGVSPAKVVRLRADLPRLDAVFLSRAEALRLADAEPDARDDALAAALRGLGIRHAVVTDGPRPAIVLTSGGVLRQAAPTVGAVKDVTGAGDTLASVAFLAWRDGQTFAAAARLGMAAASLKITARLAPACLPFWQEIAAQLPDAELIEAKDTP